MIPIGDLKRQYQQIKSDIDSAISRVLDSGWYVLGKELSFFELEFANYCGKKYGIGLGNGFDALHLTLRALNIGPGDEVITVPNTAIPTVAAITASGATPVFVDVREDSLIDPSKVEDAITENTKAIMPVHLYGDVCDINSLNVISKMHDVPIIEDCAQAHGAFYKEQTVPISNIGCFSFYPSKNLGALGDAGMVVTNNKSLSEKLKLLRHYGQSDKYHAKISGFNSRLDELQAAILRTELPYLDFWMRERRARAAVYTTSLSDIVDTPIEKLDTAHAYHLYVIQTDQRDELKEGLNERNVGSDIHYPIPLHLQEAYSHLGYHEGDFPVAERLSQRILSLPIFPQLEDKEQMKVIESVRSALE